MRSLDLRVPRDARGDFVNWAENVRSSPRAWRAPSSEEGVTAVVREAARRGGRVHVVGSGHSWSPIAAPEDVALTLDALSGIVSIDASRGRAVVRAGTRLRTLVEALDARGLALPIVGSIAHQSIAGVIATGTHGSSLLHGNLSSLVSAMRLVSGEGEVVALDEGDPRLAGARVHLGALGVVTEVTIAVVPAFRLAETVERVPFAEAVRTLGDVARSAEFAKVWWLPGTSHALVFRYERTGDVASRWPSARAVRLLDDVVMHGRVFPWLVGLGTRRPGLVAPLNRVVERSLVHGRRVARSDLALSTPMPILHRETEAALPLERGAEALDRLGAFVRRDGLHVMFPAELRFVRGDTNWMSPAEGADTCQLGAYAAGDDATIDRYFQGFWREMRALSARPHWGKELDREASDVLALYPGASRFRELRDQLDPRRVLANAFLRRLFSD